MSRPSKFLIIFQYSIALYLLATFYLPILVDCSDGTDLKKYFDKWRQTKRPTENLPGVAGSSNRSQTGPTPAKSSIRIKQGTSITSIRTAVTATASTGQMPMPTVSIRQKSTQIAPRTDSIRTAPTTDSIRTAAGGGGSGSGHKSIRTSGSIRPTSSFSIRSKESVQRQIASNQCACKRREPLDRMVPVENLEPEDKNKYYYTKKSAGDGSQAVGRKIRGHKFHHTFKRILFSVYHGFSVETGQCIAVKVSATEGEDHWRNESLIEVKLLKYMRNLKYPHTDQKLQHIIRIITHAEKNGKMSTVTEWADMNFREYWQNFLSSNAGNGKKLTEEIRGLIMEFLQGLVELHDIAHVIHADLKPQNVMLMPAQNGQRRGTLKIIDFGGSQRYDEQISSSQKELGEIKISVPTTDWEFPVASARYYAPEQRIHYYYEFAGLNQQSIISVKSDIWSLGNIIYEMVVSIHNNIYETETPNEFIYNKFPPYFIETDTENLAYIYEKMRDFYKKSEDLLKSSPHKKYIRPLIYMARACLHADPRRRPLASELLKFVRNEWKMTVSKQYQKDRKYVKGYTYDDLLY